MKKKQENKEKIEEKDNIKKAEDKTEKQLRKILAVRKARITKESNKLNKLFDVSSPEKKHVVSKLIERASFLLILAEDMETDIKKDDLIVKTINASQQFTKSNPLLKDYRDTVKSYQTVVKQLCELTKNENSSSNDPDEPDELEQFIK